MKNKMELATAEIMNVIQKHELTNKQILIILSAIISVVNEEQENENRKG